MDLYQTQQEITKEVSNFLSTMIKPSRFKLNALKFRAKEGVGEIIFTESGKAQVSFTFNKVMLAQFGISPYESCKELISIFEKENTLGRNSVKGSECFFEVILDEQ